VSSSARKTADAVIAAARRQGWRIVDGGKGAHTKLFPPDGGRPVVVSCSPGRSRATANLLAQARRSGLEVQVR
jgi:predicted RNA binding protein YcfA (HicA-like mRNA interferase family)